MNSSLIEANEPLSDSVKNLRMFFWRPAGVFLPAELSYMMYQKSRMPYFILWV